MIRKDARDWMRSVWRWVAVLLVLGTVLDVSAGPPESKLPGRKPDSQEPWSLFLGKAAHTAIGAQYLVQRSGSDVFLDKDLLYIFKEGSLGDPDRLSAFVKRLRPDITDTTALVLFEIKPDNERGREEGREQVGQYLVALNTAVDSNRQLTRGTGYEGSLFLEFENGGALWKLTWHTPEPGVTVYRWSYRRPRPGSSWEERAAQQEEEFPSEELEKYAPLAQQAIQNAYGGGERPTGFRGQVYRTTDCR